jgi:hypothetical protein
LSSTLVETSLFLVAKSSKISYVALLIYATSLLNLTTLQVYVLFLFAFRICSFLSKTKKRNPVILASHLYCFLYSHPGI